MPILTDFSPGRRRFLRGTLAAGGVFALGAIAQRSDAETPKSAHWALLSDTHISQDPANEYRGFKPYDNLQAVIPHVLRTAPEGVLIDGDLARLKGLPGDYEVFGRLLQPLLGKMPLCLTMGNHDHRQHFLAGFSSPAGERQAVEEKFVIVLHHPPVRFLLLDSLLETDVVAGLLGKAQRSWLDSYLASSDATPTFVFVHHTLDDGDGSLLDAEKMLRILAPHKKVKAVFYGHSHRYHYDVFEGIHLINLPAVGYNFEDSEPVAWVEANLSSTGGDFTLHAFGGNTVRNGSTNSLSWRSA